MSVFGKKYLFWLIDCLWRCDDFEVFVWKEMGNLKRHVARRFRLKAGENFISTDYKGERIRQPEKMKVMHILLLGEKRKEENKVRGQQRKKNNRGGEQKNKGKGEWQTKKRYIGEETIDNLWVTFRKIFEFTMECVIWEALMGYWHMNEWPVLEGPKSYLV
eukprot:gene21000-23051_t